MLSTLCKRATIKNTNEDSIWVEEKEQFIIGTIADGCSTGINSGFASRLLCYMFKNRMPYPEILTELSNFFIECIISDLRDIAERLYIDKMHLLSTFIPFHYNKLTKTLRIRPFGDGFYSVNGEEHSIEQNNTPDYIGYQINEGFAGNSMYLDKYPELIFTGVNEFVIASDGIDSFKANQFGDSDINPKEFLLLQPTAPNILDRRYNILVKNKFTNSDDVSIISYTT